MNGDRPSEYDGLVKAMNGLEETIVAIQDRHKKELSVYLGLESEIRSKLERFVSVSFTSAVST